MKTRICRFHALGLAVAAIFTLLNARPFTARAENTIFTYQGCVLDNGTNFTGLGLFKFAVVTSTNANHQAIAAAVLSGNTVASYTVVNGGNGYVTAPLVHLVGGGGSGATASAVINGGVVTAVNPVSAGSGYSGPPTVMIDPPPADISYTTYWSNDGSSTGGSEPAAGVSVAVTNGMFLAALGDTNIGNMEPIDQALFVQPNLQLRVWFSDGVNGFAALCPPHNLTTAPYAAFASTASNLLGTLPAAQVSGTLPGSQVSGSVMTAIDFTGSLSGDVTGTQNSTVVSAVGGQSASNIASSVAAANAGTSANSANTMVRRDASGSFSAGNISAAAISGDGSGLINVNATKLGGAIAGDFWQLDGNQVSPGQFLGSTNNQAVEFWVNKLRALRLEPPNEGDRGAVNIIGGAPPNVVAPWVHGSVIAGGGTTNFEEGGYPIGNSVSAHYSFIGGGSPNSIDTNANFSVLVGGGWNSIQQDSSFAIVGGGRYNVIQTRGSNSIIAGGEGNLMFDLDRYCVISGGEYNAIKEEAYDSFVGGGHANTIGKNSYYGVLGGGRWNLINSRSEYSTLGGGQENLIDPDSYYSFLGGGQRNSIGFNSPWSVIAGGWRNGIADSCDTSFIGGGFNNCITVPFANDAVICGGIENEVRGAYGMILGGYSNTAGAYSFAAGVQAHGTNTGVFVWSDSTGTATPSTTNNQFVARASGGFVFYTGTNAVGAQLAAGETSWSVLSDRSQKKNIRPLDCSAVLDKLADVPVEQWNYNWEDNQSTPHLGPMAQDFKTAFYPGRDDKSISTLEFDGVELAAIQGLNQRLDELKSEVRLRDAENAELKARLAELEMLVHKLAEAAK